MADSFIKPDPEASGSPANAEEDDLYEDAGDLEFYDKNAPGSSLETLYLARIPKSMWDAWIKMTERVGDDDEIQIGTLRTWNEPKPDGTMDVRSIYCPELLGNHLSNLTS
jgi:transcription initiation factor TFIIF subunit beta